MALRSIGDSVGWHANEPNVNEPNSSHRIIEQSINSYEQRASRIMWPESMPRMVEASRCNFNVRIAEGDCKYQKLKQVKQALLTETEKLRAELQSVKREKHEIIQDNNRLIQEKNRAIQDANNRMEELKRNSRQEKEDLIKRHQEEKQSLTSSIARYNFELNKLKKAEEEEGGQEKKQPVKLVRRWEMSERKRFRMLNKRKRLWR